MASPSSENRWMTSPPGVDLYSLLDAHHTFYSLIVSSAEPAD